MKKRVLSGILLLLLCGLCACGKENQENSQEKVADSRETTAAEAEEPETEPDQGESNGEDNQIKEAESSYARGKRIEEQSFQVELSPLGQVTFASYEPDRTKNPLADAVFLIEQEGSVPQELSGVTEDNCREKESFHQVEAVSFLDYNQDGCDDIIVICSYEPVSGQATENTFSEVRYYSGSLSGSFIYEEQMSRDACSALAEITVQTAKEYIGADRKPGSIEPWQQAYLNYLKQDSDTENQEGYVLIYVDDNEIPELVEIGNCEASGCRIVSYWNETVQVEQLNRLYFSYIEHGGLLCNSDGNMDSYYDLVYEFIDGKMEPLAQGYYGAKDNSRVELDEAGNPIYEYEWNGVKMSKEEYGRELNKVYDMSRAKDGYNWEEVYSVEEMIGILENFYG